MRIAVPRALHYHYFHPHWEAFFRALGNETVVTRPTDRALLERGSFACIADICLPVKAYMGHLEEAKKAADAVFIPRLVSLDPSRYYCPKFLALPDLARAKAPGLEILTVEINAKRGADFARKEYLRLARELGASRAKAVEALDAAEAAQEAWKRDRRERFEKEFLAGGGGFRIALVGHPYVVEDPALSSGVKAWLEERGARVATYDMVPGEPGGTEETGLLREIYWECAHSLAHAAIRFLARPDVDGMVLLSAFGCGPDSFLSDILGRRARRQGKIPFVRLLLDEHTARDGLETRLEAFLDMVGFRKRGRESY